MILRICSGVLPTGMASSLRMLLLHVGLPETLADRVGDFLRDRLRGSGRRRHRHPGDRGDARQCLRDGRHVRIILEALLLRDRDELEIAGVDIAFVGEQIVRDHVDGAGEQVVDRRLAAPIEHRRHLEAGLHHHQFAEQMPGVGDTLVAVVDLAVIGFRIGDELRHVVHRQRLLHEDDQRIGRKHADRLERPRIERRLGEHQMRDAVAELRAAEQRIAVRRSPHHLLHADAPARAARPVLDHHLLAEPRRGLLGGIAAQKVGGTAGRKRHHHGDPAVREIGLRQRRAASERKERRAERCADEWTSNHERSPCGTLLGACREHSPSPRHCQHPADATHRCERMAANFRAANFTWRFHLPAIGRPAA